MLAIRSIIDVITNSSSEAFILKTEDICIFDEEDVVWDKLTLDRVKEDIFDSWGPNGFEYIEKLCPNVRWTGFSSLQEWFDYNEEELSKVFNGQYSFSDIDDYNEKSTEYARDNYVWYESRH